MYVKLRFLNFSKQDPRWPVLNIGVKEGETKASEQKYTTAGGHELLFLHVTDGSAATVVRRDGLAAATVTQAVQHSR
jgi:hypothetical protein